MSDAVNLLLIFICFCVIRNKEGFPPQTDQVSGVPPKADGGQAVSLIENGTFGSHISNFLVCGSGFQPRLTQSDVCS